MLAMLSTSLIVVLWLPFGLAIIVGITYFFISDQEQAERLTSRLVSWAFSLTLFGTVLAVASWFTLGMPSGTISLFDYSLGEHYAIHLRLFYDTYALGFLLTHIFITNLITFYSHRYLHRDPQYRRFFFIISMFAFGMSLIILSGTFDLIFAGWEIVGLSSFLLIGYFWHRPKAIAAATMAYYIYRFCDVGLLASFLIIHFFWHDVDLFTHLAQNGDGSVLATMPIGWRWLLSLGILLPVLGKSAQIPFCFWLPKAMEGPTHSSAIFYGSLSIHAGVYLLIRTMPIWHLTPGFNYLLAAIGIITAVVATLCANVQSNIKGQIGYASIAQVGLMLVELSLGFSGFAFFHMIGNALLRCFQLLVSGSILTTHLHMERTVKAFSQLASFSLPQLLPRKLQPTIYVFAINDGYFEHVLKVTFVEPLMSLAQFLNGIFNKIIDSTRKTKPDPVVSRPSVGLTMHSAPLIAVFILVLIIGVATEIFYSMTMVTLLLSILFAFCSIGEKNRPERTLYFAIISSLLAFLSLTSGQAGSLFAIGLSSSSILALDALYYMIKRFQFADLSRNHGAFGQFPAAASLCLMGILGIISFPLSATYFGEEILLNLAIEAGGFFLFNLMVIFVINGASLIRMYSITMLGRRDNYSKYLQLDFNKQQTVMRLLLFLSSNTLAFMLAHGA